MSRLSDATLVDRVLDDFAHSREARRAYINELLMRVKNKDDDSASTRYWTLIQQGRSATEAVSIIKVHNQLLADTSLDKIEF